MAKSSVIDKTLEIKIKKEIEEMFKTTNAAYCQKAADELTKTAKYAIEAFYNDYDPTWYKRTYNLEKNSYERYYKNNGRRCWGGVFIGTDNMNAYYRDSRHPEEGLERDPYLVAATAWESGLHGIEGWHTEEGRSRIVPMDLIDQKMKDAKFLQELEYAAQDAFNLKRKAGKFPNLDAILD